MISKKLVIATPAQAAGSLVGSFASELRQRLEEIPYPPLAILYLAYEENAVRKTLNGFGFLVPPSEGLSILGCVWNSSLFEGRAPAGMILLTVFMGGATNPDVAKLSDGELVVTAHSELQRAMGIEGEPHVVGITRLDHSIPQYNLGHAARVAEIEKLVAEVPGLTLIGNYLHGVSTGDCISEAERAARNVLAGLQ
jgi:oxygen-dependent protoporphyrinogen oxidase